MAIFGVFGVAKQMPRCPMTSDPKRACSTSLGTQGRRSPHRVRDRGEVTHWVMSTIWGGPNSKSLLSSLVVPDFHQKRPDFLYFCFYLFINHHFWRHDKFDL